MAVNRFNVHPLHHCSVCSRHLCMSAACPGIPTNGRIKHVQQEALHIKCRATSRHAILQQEFLSHPLYTGRSSAWQLAQQQPIMTMSPIFHSTPPVACLLSSAPRRLARVGTTANMLLPLTPRAAPSLRPASPPARPPHTASCAPLYYAPAATPPPPPPSWPAPGRRQVETLESDDR